VERIETREQFVNALSQPCYQLVLSDCVLPGFSGAEALILSRQSRPELPFIFVSGQIGEEAAIDSLRQGATDYVLKHRLSRLAPAVRRALEESARNRSLHELEVQLAHARKLEALGTALGGLAHDFRNLLQILKSGIEILSLKATGPELVEITRRLLATTDRGCEMVDEILVFARKTRPVLIAIDVVEQVTGLTQSLRAFLPPRIQLTLDLPSELPWIAADPQQLARMLTNLVVNARDAITERGRISIIGDLIEFDPNSVKVWGVDHLPYLRLRVCDSGSGMDEATQSRVFEPFFTTKAAGKGTGLGLAVVFGLIQAHCGFIDLESEVDQGTTISLFFPLLSHDTPYTKITSISPVRLLGLRTESHSRLSG
jgi:signal transduction histidine kinase